MRYVVFFIALLSFVALFAQSDSPVLLAKFSSTPAGTQYRTGSNAEWQTAYVNDPLYENYEARNTQKNDYGLTVYSDVEIDFPDGATDVIASSYKGTAEYKDIHGTWYTLPVGQTVSATSLRTYASTTLPVSIKSGRGILCPKPPSGGGDSAE